MNVSIPQAAYPYDLTVSIVTYKTDVMELQKCIQSILCCTLRTRIIIIDNSPSDRLRRSVIPFGCEYRWLQRNVGFGAGHNIAIRESVGLSRYHLVLNADVSFEADVLEQLTSYMDMSPGTGAVMPRILYRDGSPQHLCKLLPRPWDLLLRRLPSVPIRKLFREQMERFELRHLDNHQIMRVPMISGCCMFVRARVFGEVGLFDERYFMYHEDFDLCRRIHAAYDVVYYPRVSIVHGYARGSYKPGILMWHHICSAVKYFSKWGWFVDREGGSINRAALAQIYQGKAQRSAESVPERDPYCSEAMLERKRLSRASKASAIDNPQLNSEPQIQGD